MRSSIKWPIFMAVRNVYVSAGKAIDLKVIGGFRFCYRKHVVLSSFSCTQLIFCLFNKNIHRWYFVHKFSDLMKILTVIHNYYEQILTKFIFARFAICTKSSVLLDEKGNGISKCEKDKQKALALLVKKGKKLFSAIFSLPLRGGKIDTY